MSTAIQEDLTTIKATVATSLDSHAAQIAEVRMKIEDLQSQATATAAQRASYQPDIQRLSASITARDAHKRELLAELKLATGTSAAGQIESDLDTINAAIASATKELAPFLASDADDLKSEQEAREQLAEAQEKLVALAATYGDLAATKSRLDARHAEHAHAEAMIEIAAAKDAIASCESMLAEAHNNLQTAQAHMAGTLSQWPHLAMQTLREVGVFSDSPEMLALRAMLDFEHILDTCRMDISPSARHALRKQLPVATILDFGGVTESAASVKRRSAAAGGPVMTDPNIYVIENIVREVTQELEVATLRSREAQIQHLLLVNASN